MNLHLFLCISILGQDTSKAVHYLKTLYYFNKNIPPIFFALQTAKRIGGMWVVILLVFR